MFEKLMIFNADVTPVKLQKFIIATTGVHEVNDPGYHHHRRSLGGALLQRVSLLSCLYLFCACNLLVYRIPNNPHASRHVSSDRNSAHACPSLGPRAGDGARAPKQRKVRGNPKGKFQGEIPRGNSWADAPI